MKVGDIYRNLVTGNRWCVKAINGRLITLTSASPKLRCEYKTTLELMLVTGHYEKSEG